MSEPMSVFLADYPGRTIDEVVRGLLLADLGSGDTLANPDLWSQYLQKYGYSSTIADGLTKLYVDEWVPDYYRHPSRVFAAIGTDRVRDTTDLASVSLDDSVTFSRAGARLAFNSSGVLASNTNNVWPLEYNPTTLEPVGRSIWGASTNLFLYSNTPANAYWTKANVTIVADDATAPDGTETMMLVLEDTASSSHLLRRSISWTSGTTYTVSRYVKPAGRNWCRLFFGSSAFSGGPYAYFNLEGEGSIGTTANGATAKIERVGTDTYRVSMTATATATVSANTDFSICAENGSITYTGDGTKGIHVWGSQLEANSTPTPYIATTTGTAGRVTDTATITDLTDLSYSQTVGTVVVRGVLPVSGLNKTILSFNNGTANEQMVLKWTGTQVVLTITDGGVTVATLTSTPVETGAFCAAFSYSVTDSSLSVNGLQAVTETTGSLPTVSQLNIGKDSAGANALDGYIESITYVQRQLIPASLPIASTL